MRSPTESAPITGLGPHGEAPAGIDQLQPTETAADAARAAGYEVVVVLHTTRSDWAKQQLAGISSTLESYGARIADVIDCEFQADRQVRVLDSLLQLRPDAVISIPVDNVATADAHGRLGEAGIRLVLMDNAPAGLLPGKHYVSVVSADNFGNGQVAALILSMYVPDGGRVAIIGYGADFYSTNEREIGFRKMMRERRPDLHLLRVEFADTDRAGEAAERVLRQEPDLSGMFVVWDDPAMQGVEAVRAANLDLPMTTVDLGNQVALEIASDGIIKGVGAQQPYDQGMAEALAVIMALAGEEPPPWVALPGLAVTRQNVLDAYQRVWHVPPPPGLREALEATRGRRRG